EVVRRRTEFDLSEAEKRAHILEGLKIALDHLDEVIALIRKSKDTDTALTGLERDKIQAEYLEVIQLIEKLRAILASDTKMLSIIQDEVKRLRDKYGD